MDAHCIAPKLWQGSVPAPGLGPHREGFDVVVFCAEEYQPPAGLYPGVKVIHAPNDDSGRPPTQMELNIARRASKLAAAHVMSGDKVLVTCMQGRNRSGLVTALTLVRLYGISGGDAMKIVKTRRRHSAGEALSNPHFANILERVRLGKAA